ncbi:MAG: AMP-binding protein [Oscillospiraceae bacterium]|jgi:phenylacetate-coenzyme A ligase PaaK-like adenylate-forming protein|nr:AMP-binding protein [Oscillospiraceae bacterium]
MSELTPLDGWIAGKLASGARVDPQTLETYQAKRLHETLRYVKEHSRFYAERLVDIDAERISDSCDLRSLPFTRPEDLAGRHMDFLCVPPGEIARIVTLPTSGTTGAPKRVCFTPEDIELTLDFFSHGMSTLAPRGARVMIFMPGDTDSSVGALLRAALGRIDCEGIVCGAVRDPAAAALALADTGCECAVGLPSQMYEVATAGVRNIKLKSMLLSADYAPRAVSSGIERLLGCKVFDHYGMTEMGFGGGVECSARDGYHMRDADMLFEIVDPVTQLPARDGEYGEVVFTTLTRLGMPLVRYATGDRSRRITLACPCGTPLTRIERISGRIRDASRLLSGQTLSMAQLDDIIYSVPGVASFAATLTTHAGADCLTITAKPSRTHFDPEELKNALTSSAPLRRLVESGALLLNIKTGAPPRLTTGASKRKITDLREPALPSHSKTIKT